MSSNRLAVQSIQDTFPGTRPGGNLDGHDAAHTFAPPTSPAPSGDPNSMTDSLQPRIDMLHRTLDVFDGQPDLWTAKRPIASNVALVRDGLAEIERAVRAQVAGDPKGLTQNKAIVRETANTRLAVLAAKTEVFAAMTGDADLEAAADISLTRWRRMPEAVFFGTADSLLDRIDAALDALAEYEVTKTDLIDARAALDALQPLTSVRDRRRGERVAATEDLDVGYSAVVAPLGFLDTLVPLQIKDRDFVAAYRIARRIDGD